MNEKLLVICSKVSFILIPLFHPFWQELGHRNWEACTDDLFVLLLLPLLLGLLLNLNSFLHIPT